jgi:hypothetical protein
MTKQVPPPKLDLFLVAESIRQEPGGKLTFIGVFSFGQIVLPKDTAIPAVITTSIFMAFKDGEGTFEGSMTVTYPDGQQGVFNFGKVTKQQGTPLTLIVSMPAFTVTSLGRFSVEAKLDTNTYQGSFTVGIAP